MFKNFGNQFGTAQATPVTSSAKYMNRSTGGCLRRMFEEEVGHPTSFLFLRLFIFQPLSAGPETVKVWNSEYNLENNFLDEALCTSNFLPILFYNKIDFGFSELLKFL